MKRTLIRNLPWLVAWDGERHVYRRNGDLVIGDDRVIHVGGRYEGVAEREIDGSALMAMPGFVNIHGHLGHEPLGKGFYEELGSHKLQMSRIYEFIYTIRADSEAIGPATRYAVAELMQSGCTTVADMAFPYPGWVDVLAGTGVRAFIAPMFRSAHWVTPNDHAVEYRWDEAAGERGFAEAMAIVEAAEKHPSGLLGGIVMPAQVDTCTPDLLRKAYAAARERKLPYQTHLGQALLEFHEMVRRHGTTPVGYLESLGVLGPTTTIAHGILLDHHPWIRWHEQADIGRLVRSGTTVVHCPQVFAYRGLALNHLGAYRQAGMRLAIGTDTFPHDMLDELRLAITLSKVLSGHVDLLRLSHLFHMATIGGADALGRSDLGRLAPGAKADLVLVDLEHPKMAPLRDPLRSLVFSAGRSAVRHVFVDGNQVVEDGATLAIDVAAESRRITEGQGRALANTANKDWAKRSADEISPYALDVV